MGIRYTGIILISLLYCYATGRLNAYSGKWEPKKELTSNQTILSQADSFSGFFHISQTKISVNSFNNNLPSPDEKQFNELSCLVKFKERFLFNKITRLLYIESGIFICFPKTDIIFPFHYFW